MSLPQYIETNSGGWITDVNAGSPLGQVRQGVLDELLRKGLWLPPPAESSKDGLIVMLRGKAGTGKSTLALELAANLRVRRDSAAKRPHAETEFFSLEQDAAELKAIVCRLIANQCRSRFALLNAMRHNDDVLEAMVAEMADLLGVAKPDNKLKELIRTVLLQNLEKETDRSGKLAAFLSESRVRFSGRDHGTEFLGEDPLERAYGFVAEGLPVTKRSNDNRLERPVVIIDGLSILSEEERSRFQLAALIDMLRQRCLIGVIAYEPSAGIEESLDHQVDVVIELEEKHLSAPIDYLVHALHFKKTRYQEAALGWHQYKIRSYGFDIYPSVHFQVHSHGYMPRQLMGSLNPIEPKKRDETKAAKGPSKAVLVMGGEKTEARIEKGWSVIEQVLGGIKPGDSIALLGPRGAFKTALTLDFLFRSRCRPEDKLHPDEGEGPYAEDACARNRPPESGDAQHGLLVSVIDNEDTLRIQKACPLVKEGQKPCRGFGACCSHAFLFYQRPGAIASSEFLYYLKTRLQVAQPPISRLAFWDLTQLEYRFPLLANDPMFVPALLDLFKIKMVKSMFMGAANARLSNTIAAVADNVLFCWRDRVKPDLLNDPKLDPELSEKVTGLTERIWSNTGEQGPDYLMIYVDRTSGGFAQERKNLHAFPILGGFQLFVPAGPWELSNYAIRADEIPFFDESAGQIRHVTEMQGFASDAAKRDQAEA